MPTRGRYLSRAASTVFAARIRHILSTTPSTVAAAHAQYNTRFGGELRDGVYGPLRLAEFQARLIEAHNYGLIELITPADPRLIR